MRLLPHYSKPQRSAKPSASPGAKPTQRDDAPGAKGSGVPLAPVFMQPGVFYF
jgi:hypothetical protein